MKYDLNNCLYVAPFLTGSGFDTCLGTLVSLNVEGTVGTKRSFYRHQQNIASNIRNITSSVISEAKEAEICATIFDILEGKGHSKLEC